MNKNTQPLLQEVEEEEEEEYSRLSFCDLPISGAVTPHRPASPPDNFFEFSAAAAGHPYYNDVIFCGKVIHVNEDDDQEQLNEFHKRDYFATVKSNSLHKPSFHDAAGNRKRSASTRFSGDLARPKWSGSDPVYHAQSVNITSLTSMSAKSRRRMFMFGPVKFKPEMELSSIKQRQAKMSAASAEKAPPPPRSRWGVVKSSLGGRSQLARVLARSLGCMPAAAGGGGLKRWVGVAN